MKSIARTAILGLSLSAAALMGTAHAAGAGQDVGEHLDYPVLQTASSKSRQARGRRHERLSSDPAGRHAEP